MHAQNPNEPEPEKTPDDVPPTPPDEPKPPPVKEPPAEPGKKPYIVRVPGVAPGTERGGRR